MTFGQARCLWIVLLLMVLLPGRLPAAVVSTGDVSPNVNFWRSRITSGYVGHVFGDGNVTVDAGSQLASYVGYLGYRSGTTGTVTVTGAGSKWTSDSLLFVGYDGAGTLTVSDGGEVVAGTLYASLSDLHGNGTITASGAVLDADFTFNATHGTSQSFAFGSGGTLKVTVGNGGFLGAGYKQSGSLTISEGVNVSSSYGYLGWKPGSMGTATVTGVGSKWTNSSSLYVGPLGSTGTFGTSTLTVSDGGEVVAESLYASLSDLHGNGTITATAGAVLDADFTFDATDGASQSYAFGSGGTLNVTFDGGALGAGFKQSGSLTISEGVNVSSSYGSLGLNSGSTGVGTVTGSGSKWVSSDDLRVGYFGDGVLLIEAGGEVSNTKDGYIGSQSGSTGAATVIGADSKWTNSGSLYVGNRGAGTLLIEGGGEVSNTTGYLGYYSSSSSRVTVTGAGSKWINSSNLYVGNSGSGALTIEDGGLVSVRGKLTIDNNSPADSSVNMQTGGALALYGDADDSLSQFLGLVQGTDAIRFWDDSLSDWASLTTATLGVDYSLEHLTVGDLAGYTLLTVGETVSFNLAGDYNNDGFVNAADYTIWRDGLGAVYSQGDYILWADNYGATVNAGAEAVPEPTAMAVALVTLAGSGWRGSSRQGNRR